MKKNTTVAILGSSNETHCLQMQQALKSLKAKPVIIDTLVFPEQSLFSLKDNDLRYQGCSLNKIDVFYLSGIFYGHLRESSGIADNPQSIDLDEIHADSMAEKERQAFLTSWLRSAVINGKRIVNPVDSFELSAMKPYQLSLLRSKSIPVPRTLATNDINELNKFRQECGLVVYQPVHARAECRLMDKDDWVPERLELLRSAPVFFQEYIAGADIRAYLIGSKVVAAVVLCSSSEAGPRVVEQVELPANIENICVKAMRACGMEFTVVDLKRKPDGKYVVMGCDYPGMFAVFQQDGGEIFAQRLAELLVKGR